MFITGLGTAKPCRRFTQRECWEFGRSAERVKGLSPRSQALLRKVLTGDNGIESRYLVLSSLEESLEISPDVLHARFRRYAPELATRAAEAALRQSRSAISEIDALLISTCTGYLCPGLTSYVSERLGLRADALLLDLVGQGCAAALPNLSTADALITSRRAGRVLSICVEVCSAAFFLDDDPGVLISACLFGDGAAAAVLSNEAVPSQRRLEWKKAGTLLSAADRDYLRFEQKNGLLRNILSRQVPALAGKHASAVLAQVLAGSGLGRSDISAWIMHGAGRDVLTSLAEALALSRSDLRWTEAVLRECGNLSSASVLFVLEEALRGGAPGGYWWMSSFGAGFSCHGALLHVQAA